MTFFKATLLLRCYLCLCVGGKSLACASVASPPDQACLVWNETRLYNTALPNVMRVAHNSVVIRLEDHVTKYDVTSSL